MTMQFRHDAFILRAWPDIYQSVGHTLARILRQRFVQRGMELARPSAQLGQSAIRNDGGDLRQICRQLRLQRNEVSGGLPAQADHHVPNDFVDIHQLWLGSSFFEEQPDPADDLARPRLVLNDSLGEVDDQLAVWAHCLQQRDTPLLHLRFAFNQNLTHQAWKAWARVAYGMSRLY